MLIIFIMKIAKTEINRKYLVIELELKKTIQNFSETIKRWRCFYLDYLFSSFFFFNNRVKKTCRA